jgi:hypothetical protein
LHRQADRGALTAGVNGLSRIVPRQRLTGKNLKNGKYGDFLKINGLSLHYKCHRFYSNRVQTRHKEIKALLFYSFKCLLSFLGFGASLSNSVLVPCSFSPAKSNFSTA